MSDREKLYVPWFAQITGGALGVSILILFTILTLEKLDTPLRIALVCTAVSIPFLCARLLMLIIEEKTGNFRMVSLHGLLTYSMGILGSYVAIVSIFFHFSILYGVLFVVVTVAAFLIILRFVEKELPEENQGKQIVKNKSDS